MFGGKAKNDDNTLLMSLTRWNGKYERITHQDRDKVGRYVVTEPPRTTDNKVRFSFPDPSDRGVEDADEQPDSSLHLSTQTLVNQPERSGDQTSGSIWYSLPQDDLASYDPNLPPPKPPRPPCGWVCGTCLPRPESRSDF